MRRGSWTEYRIVPRLLSVPSTFLAISGVSSLFIGRLNRFAKFWSMKVPPAPLSIRAWVSTIFSVFSPRSEMGMCMDLPFVSATNTEWISRQGEANIDLALPIKNPLHQFLQPSSWFLLLLLESVGRGELRCFDRCLCWNSSEGFGFDSGFGFGIVSWGTLWLDALVSRI